MRLLTIFISLQLCFSPIMFLVPGFLKIPLGALLAIQRGIQGCPGIQRAIEAIFYIKDTRELNNLMSRQRISRQTRAAKEDGKIDELKCFDKIPNCKRELCQRHQNSFGKNCKKTCGYCKHLKQVGVTVWYILAIYLQWSYLWLTNEHDSVSMSYSFNSGDFMLEGYLHEDSVINYWDNST